MKLRVDIILVIAFAFCAICLAREIPIDGYAAIVNKRIITVGDVLSLIQPLRHQLSARYFGYELEKKLLQAFLEGRKRLVDEALMLTDFEAKEGELPGQAVDDRIKEIIDEKFGGERTELLKALAEQNISYSEWRKKIRENIIIYLLQRQNVYEQITIAPQAIRRAYLRRLGAYTTPRGARIRMIVFNKEKEEGRDPRAHAKQVHGDLLSGVDFGVMARTVSSGTKNDKGGDWGWVRPKTLRPELKNIVEKLEPGEISEVVEVDDSYYIIKVEEKREFELSDFNEVRDELENELRNAEAEKLYDQWIDRLSTKYFVKLFPIAEAQ